MTSTSSPPNLAATTTAAPAYERGFERCVVTFIDILGYRRLLKTRHAEDIANVVKALRNFTAGDSDGDEQPSRSDEDTALHAGIFRISVGRCRARADNRHAVTGWAVRL